MYNITRTETIETPVNVIWDKLKKVLLNAQEQHVPTKMSSKRFSQPWFNQACKRAVRKKVRRYRVFKRTKNHNDWIKFQEEAKKARKTCNENYNAYVKRNFTENDDDKNSKKFYSFIKAKRSDIVGVSPLIDSDGVTQCDDNIISEILSDQFASVFSQDDGSIPHIAGPQNPEIDDIVFTSNGITKLLKNLNIKKASGPDEVSARILNKCANEISDALVLLFSASIHQGTMPDEWRHATIAPIYKGNNKNRSKAENYRPVSLTSVTCKVMEHVIHSHIMKHLENYNTLSEKQHGFRKYRSCETQLLETVNSIGSFLNDRKRIDSILLDFSKAFDKVCHRKLLLKIKHYGIKGNLHKWISNFLLNRTQSVVVRGTFSESKPVLSGVPQGTALGPLLFLIYINDMPLVVESPIALFADDAFIYRPISTNNDANALQNDLNNLMQWEKSWSMEFHPSKCQLLRITNKKKIIDSNYTIHCKKLELVDTAKYLGVTLSKNLSWKHHIGVITSKAHNMRLFLQRNFVKANKETKLKCYNIYVRPIIEYASSVWNPINQTTLISRLEMVQRKSIRWIFSDWKRDVSVTNLRQSLGMKTLETRRTIAQLKTFHELIHFTKHVEKEILPKRQRCLDIKFKPLYGCIKSYSQSFFPHVVKLWNSLPRNIINMKNKIGFNKEIEKFFI